MITERETDLIQVELEAYLESLLKEFMAGYLGDRDNGILYDQEGRQPVSNSEGERSQLRQPVGGQPRGADPYGGGYA